MHESLINIRRTPYQSLSMFLIQLFVVFLTLTLISGTLFVLSVLNTVEAEPRVVVYFEPKTPEADIFKIREFISRSGQTTKIDYVDKQKAFEIYKKQAGDNQLLIEDTTPDIFPASLEIKARNAAMLEDIAAYLRKQTGVDEVQYQKSTINRLLSITSIIRTSVLVFVLFLSAMTVIILSTMITYKIALRREEIEIYQLLGAMSGYIDRPFFIESYIITTLATAVGCGLFIGALHLVDAPLSSYLAGIPSLVVSYSQYTLTIWPKNFIFIGLLSLVTWIYMTVISTIATKISTNKFRE